MSEQQLLTQKFKLEKRIDQLLQEIKALKQTIQHFQILRQQMIELAPDVYAKRCEIVIRSIGALKLRISRLCDLVNGYNHLIEMMSIEYQASRLSGQFLNNVSSQGILELEEVKILKRKKQELALRIGLE